MALSYDADVVAINTCILAKPPVLPATLTLIAIAIIAIFTLLWVSEVNDATAILVEPYDSSKYQIRWTRDHNASRYIGLIETQIKIIDESSHKIVGYVADKNGTRLEMYNDEQVVFVKFYLQDGSVRRWEIADRPYKGYFAISTPQEIVGKVDRVRIFVNNHMYTINDSTLTSRQSWVFINSAQTTHKFSNVTGPNLMMMENEEEDLKGNKKYDVHSYDTPPGRFLTSLRNVIILYDKGLAIVWYDLPIAADIGVGAPSIMCDPAPGSVLSPGTNIVRCSATYDNDNDNDDASQQSVHSYFKVDVADYYNQDDTHFTQSLMRVQIDIDPFYPEPNTVNLRYTTLTSVAILGNAGINVREIDQNLIQFGPNGIPPASSAESYFTDVNADGADDLVLKFDVLKAGLYEGYSDYVCLVGTLKEDGTGFKACDIIYVVAK